MANNQKFKIVLLGEGRVGKTSLLLRFTRGEFSERQVSTIQASFLEKKVNVDGQPVQLAVWDTAGQERFHALGPIYYRDADGACLVYDITDAESFEKAKNWVKELKKIVGDISIAIAGNKIDLEKDRHVDENEVKKYAESVGAIHMHTSAKANRGVDEIFSSLANEMLKKRKSSGASSSGGENKKKLMIVDEEPAKPKSGGFC